VRVALLAVGDGSARRSAAAPGHLDSRAAAFDTSVEHALGNGDMAALASLDQDLARGLLATGRAAWQVLAGAVDASGVLAGDLLYADAPFGVGCFVAVLEPENQLRL
jgi:aromatic ring-opening dioxygenase LigB subunit